MRQFQMLIKFIFMAVSISLKVIFKNGGFTEFTAGSVMNNILLKLNHDDICCYKINIGLKVSTVTNEEPSNFV